MLMNKNGSFRSHQTCNDKCVIFIKSLILLVLWSQVLVWFLNKLINFQWKVKFSVNLICKVKSSLLYIYTLSFCEGNLATQVVCRYNTEPKFMACRFWREILSKKARLTGIWQCLMYLFTSTIHFYWENIKRQPWCIDLDIT